MALGDVVSKISSVANNGVLDIRPSAGEEWVIHNIYYSGAVEFSISNDTGVVKFDMDGSGGARLGAVFHVKNNHYLQIKNVSGGVSAIGYDGIQTK